ncbi:MAG: hypothetical protein IPK00_13025 [Deltaproteobacteria bacterium]|nr:hypothetical protein [Deltaproteobacteria bacterium]
MSSEPLRPRARFSLVVGGPFHRLLTRLGGMGPDGLPRPRTALILATLAWSIPAVAVVVQSLLDETYSGWVYFSDATVYARFLVTIAVLIMTEHYADGRFEILIREFRATRIIGDDQDEVFLRALDQADRRSSSAFAEGVLVVLALGLASFGTRVAAGLVVGGWEGDAVDGGVVLSWAGMLASLVSGPLFFFLLLRWCWRFVVWTLLLFRLSGLQLDLMPLHPDRCGGLGFLALYPSIFTGFVFALSSVVAVTVLKELRFVALSTDQIQWMLGIWLAVVVVLFLGPLAVFVPLLRRAREQALIEYGRLAHQHHHAFRRRWLDSGRTGEELIGSPDPSSSSDLNAIVTTAQEMRVFPIDHFAVVQLLGAAGLPLLAVALTRVPLVELVRRIGMGFL